MYKPTLRVSGVNIDITPAMQEIAEKKMAAMKILPYDPRESS